MGRGVTERRWPGEGTWQARAGGEIPSSLPLAPRPWAQNFSLHGCLRCALMPSLMKLTRAVSVHRVRPTHFQACSSVHDIVWGVRAQHHQGRGGEEVGGMVLTAPSSR